MNYEDYDEVWDYNEVLLYFTEELVMKKLTPDQCKWLQFLVKQYNSYVIAMTWDIKNKTYDVVIRSDEEEILNRIKVMYELEQAYLQQ